MNNSRKEKQLKELVLGKCWNYINDNFHKFNEVNKIKVSLALIQKSMPQEIIGQMEVKQMTTIKVAEDELEFNIGDNGTAKNTRYTSEAPSCN